MRQPRFHINLYRCDCGYEYTLRIPAGQTVHMCPMCRSSLLPIYSMTVDELRHTEAVICQCKANKWREGWAE